MNYSSHQLLSHITNKAAPIVVVTAMSVAALGNAQTVESEPTTPLSLDQCLAIALSTNPSIRVADLEVQRVDYSKKEVLGQLLPSIAFGGTYNRTLAKQVAYMNMKGFGALAGGSSGEGGEGGEGEEPSRASSSMGSNGIKMGLDNSYSTGFTASLPIIAPQLWKTLRLSDAQILQSVEQARQSRLQLINKVKDAYYLLLLAKDSRRVIQESYDMASFTHQLYVKKHEAGTASEYDVLRTSVALKNIEPQIIEADIAIKQARMQLLILMGVNVNTPFDVDGTLVALQDTSSILPSAVSHDFSGNSELRLNAIAVRQLKDALSVQKAAWYPTLAANYNYNWTSSSDGSPFKNFRWTPYSVVGLTISFPIFQGGQRYYKQRQAEVQVKQMEWNRENIERSVASQVDLSIDNIRLNMEQIASSTESVRQAERAHDIMVKSFSIGAASYLDLRDSELSLTQARLSYNQAIYNYLVANSSLELLLGTANPDKYQLD